MNGASGFGGNPVSPGVKTQAACSSPQEARPVTPLIVRACISAPVIEPLARES